MKTKHLVCRALLHPDIGYTSGLRQLFAFVLLFTFVILFPVKAGCTPEDSPAVIPQGYAVSLELSPAQGFLQASALIRLEFNKPLASTLSFFLHETFRIDELALNGRKVPFSTTPAAREKTRPARQRVDIQIEEETISAPHADLLVRYSGSLKKLPQWGQQKRGKPAMDDHIGPERIELAAYSGWYPHWPGLHWFNLKLQVIAPETWKIVASGEMSDTHVQSNKFYTNWKSLRTNDVVVLGSPNFREVQIPAGSDFGTISVLHTRLPLAFIRSEASEIAFALKKFTQWLTPPLHAGTTLRHVYSPRELGQGGYARPGLIITSEGRIHAALETRPELSLMRGNAHELAHFWWNFGRDQGDWINETFAEFFALLALEAKGRVDEFSRLVSQYTEEVRGLPDGVPCLSKAAPENSGHLYVIRYHQGAIMLQRFRTVMGNEAFLDACRRFYLKFRETGAETRDFRLFWSNQIGLEATMVNRWLDIPRGGVHVR